VAALAVLTIPRLTAISPDSTSPSPQIASASAEHDPAPMQLAAAQAPARPDSGGTRWVDMSRPRVESRLNRYLVTHNEYASVGAVNGVLPYATFVSYDTGRP
jgi:sigma-E factor negative regulatory protein RseA